MKLLVLSALVILTSCSHMGHKCCESKCDMSKEQCEMKKEQCKMKKEQCPMKKDEKSEASEKKQ